mgnify:CR=1 FL=1
MPSFWNICLETLNIAKNVAKMNCRKVIYADTFWRYRTTHNSVLSQHQKNQPQRNQPNLKGKPFSVHDCSECLLWCWLLIINMVISLWERLSPGETESPKEKGYVLKLRRMTYWYKQQSCFILPLNLPVYANKVSCFELRNAPVRIENLNFIGIDSCRCCIVIDLRIKIQLVDWCSWFAPQHLCILQSFYYWGISCTWIEKWIEWKKCLNLTNWI